MAREDFRQRVTNALIANVEALGGLPWHQGWPQFEVRPFNPGTGEKFKGGNVLNLMLEQVRRGSSDPRWMTLAQANEAGFRIRQNAKAAHVEYWEFEWSKPVTGSPTSGRPDYGRRQGRVLYAPLFNGADIVGIPAFKRNVEWNPNELVEKLLSATGVVIKHASVAAVGGTVSQHPAAYSADEDFITVPPRESFAREGDYYATVLHQLAKWTGHHTRLNRPMPDGAQALNSALTAKEELRAEISSLFMTSMLGVSGSSVQDHSLYASGMVQTLKSDKHEVFRAAKDAEKIVAHLFDYAPELRELVEKQLVDSMLPASQKPAAVVGSGIRPGLPNFTPKDLELAGRGTGRTDPRWVAFVQTVQAEAAKAGLPESVAENAVSMVESHFSEVMDAAKAKGYSSSETNEMLARSIIADMRTADVRQEQWEKFCAQAHSAGKDLYPYEQIELALQALCSRYQYVLEQSVNHDWSREDTDAAISSLIFGEKGRRPISSEYVTELVEAFTAEAHTNAADEEIPAADDELLEPLGLSELDAPTAPNGSRYLMEDAEIHDSDGP